MEIGIFSRTYEVKDVRETFRRMKNHGIFHTQFNLANAGLDTFPTYINEDTIKEIKASADEYGIHIHAMSGTFNMINPDEEARKKSCHQFSIQCQIAKKLGIPIVTLCTGSKNRKSQWKWHEDNSKQSSWDELLRTTDTILRYAEDNQIILGVETEVSNIIATPELARKYLDTIDSPHLKIIMDGANLFRPEQVKDMCQVLQHAFGLLGKDIVLAHAKDLSLHEGVEFVAAGEGVLDFAYYIEQLRQIHYQGTVIMHGLSEGQVPKSKQYLETYIR